MRRRQRPARVLVVALMVQLALGGALIWAASTGFRFLGHVHVSGAHPRHGLR